MTSDQIISILGGTAVWITVALLIWLRFRHAALKLRASEGGDVEKLTRRVEILEKQCAELREQVLQAHTLLADEQRTLDRKLSAVLPDAPDATSRKTIGPERVQA